MPGRIVSEALALGAGLAAAILASSTFERFVVALAWQAWAEAMAGMGLRGWRAVVVLVLVSGWFAAWHAPGEVQASLAGFALTDEGIHAALDRMGLLLLWWSVGLGVLALGRRRPPSRIAHWFAAAQALRRRAHLIPWGLYRHAGRVDALAGLVALGFRLAGEAARMRWLRWPRADIARGAHYAARGMAVGTAALAGAFLWVILDG